MKKYIFILLALTTLLASCQREMTEVSLFPKIIAEIESPSGTRTQLSVDESGVGTIYWKPADQIDVFFGTTRAVYSSQNNENATTATFQTSDLVSGSEITSSNIWGLYPSNDSSTCDGNSVTTTLPSQQYGLPDSFDDNLFITLAHSSSTTLQFYNVCGGIKFSLSRDDIKSITLKGNNNEDLAGKVKLSFSGGLPKATVVNGVKEITLRPKSGQSFIKDVDYYFVTLPAAMSSGFTMTFTTTKGAVGTLNYSGNTVTMKRSIFRRQNHIDSFVTFEGESLSNNIIYYTSTDGKVVIPNNTDGFGANFISNKYIDGRGEILFDGAITSIGYASFHGCTSLASIEIPNSVTSISGWAFTDCHQLGSIIIPKSVLSIGNIAFCDCPSLTSIVVSSENPVYDSRNNCNAIIETKTNTLLFGCQNTIIPNSVTAIGDDAFENCKHLTSIEIPNSVTRIGNTAFWGCSTLSTLIIPDSVSAFGTQVFACCDGLNSIIVDSGNPIYDSRNNCNAIIETNSNTLIIGCKNTIIPTSVSSIGDLAFNYCHGLLSIEIPSSINSIGYSAFEGCRELVSISILATVPPTLKTAYNRISTFDGTNNCPIFVHSESVDVYKSADNWNEYADRIFPIESKGKNNIIYYTSTDGKIVTPNKTDVFGASIVSNEYADGRGIIRFDGDIINIGSNAFSNCSTLASIEIPALVSSISGNVFSGCSSLNSITVDTNNKFYDSRDNCNAIIETHSNSLISGCKNTNIPDSVTSIGYGAFSNQSGLSSIIIPKSVRSIGSWVFANCSGLNSIIVDSGNPIYDSRNNCNAIIETNSNTLIVGCQHTVIPDSVTNIGQSAFEGQSGLSSIVIPNSVTSIGHGAFRNCGLSSIEIPNSVTNIEMWAFANCAKLTSIVILEGLESLPVLCFDTCGSLKSVSLPQSLVSIGDGCFMRCYSLETITIPSQVSDLYYCAFYECRRLESVFLESDSVVSFNKSGMIEVYAVDEGKYGVFDKTNNCQIHVPAKLVDTYKASEDWIDYADRIQGF